MVKTNATEFCLKLKKDTISSQESDAINGLRLRILDYFISRNVSNDVFEKALKARLRDPDPLKQQSKIICAQILKTWDEDK